MANLIINDVPVEVLPGEGLLTVARREGAHIGFVCDGNGLCTTCECRVLAGRENLSPPNEVERTWLPVRRLQRGYRLACQSQVVGEGEVRVLTRAEELRRLWDGIGNPLPGTTGDDNFRRLVRKVVQLNVDHLSMFPLNLARTVNRLGLVRTILPVQDNTEWLRDIGKVIDERTDYAFGDASTPPIPPATNPPASL